MRCGEGWPVLPSLTGEGHASAPLRVRSTEWGPWYALCCPSGVRFLTVLGLVLLAAWFPSRGETPDSRARAFPFESREGLLWVEARTRRSEVPLRFLIDTGAGVSVLDRETAGRLGVKPGREVAVDGVGAKATGTWPLDLPVRAGTVALPGRYLGLDLGPLSRACGCRIDGLLGADFFKDRVTEIDFEAREVRVGGRSAASSGEVLPLNLRPGGMLVPVTIEGRGQQWVRLDTGCASALQWADAEAHAGGSPRRGAVGLGEVAIAQTTARVGIGSTSFEAVPTGVHPAPIFPGEAGLLGNGLLSRFASVLIDPRAGVVRLRTRSAAP